MATGKKRVALLGGDSPAGAALLALAGADFDLRRFADPGDPALAGLVQGGGRLVDLRVGARAPVPGLPEPLLFALPAFGWDRLQGAVHLSFPSAGAAAAVLAAQPLVEAGLFEPDTLVVQLGEGVAGPVELSSPLGEEVALGLKALGLASPRIVGSVIGSAGGGCTLALVSGLMTDPDAADPKVLRAALEAVPIDASRRFCLGGERLDPRRVAGTAVAEVAAAVNMFAERVTVACALDANAFLAAAVRTALLASAGYDVGR